MFDNTEHTHISKLGEFGLIDHISKSFEVKNKKVVKGIGDDAAVIDAGDSYMLISTDMLTEGVHFDMVYTPLKHLGYKAVAVNLSDIYAMNGNPAYITVSIALSSKFTLEAVEEIYEGIKLACENYKVDLIGGDTVSSVHGMTISVTAVGYVDKNSVAYRSGAKEFDLICVSGDLGAAYLGLQLLEREKAMFKENPNLQPDLQGYDYLLERQLKPEPRKDIVRLLHDNGIIPTSMIDISDGLSSELLHICKESNVGCDIYIEKIPVDHLVTSAAELFNMDSTTCALNGGEDYELLFTVKQADFEIVKKLKGISVIGHITSDKMNARLINQVNEATPITAFGWDAFKKAD
jgi:thiamine-monophosphate kinase